MTIDEKLVSDLDKQIKNAESIQEFMDKIYYNEEISTFFNKPVLSMLSTAATYLLENLQLQRTKYMAKYEAGSSEES